MKDTYENVKTFLDSGLLDDIKLLKSHTWKGKRIVLFVNGDYLFVSCVYGLSGAKGTYPCLWCNVNGNKMQERTELCNPRTLYTLNFHHGEFMRAGKGYKKMQNSILTA